MLSLDEIIFDAEPHTYKLKGKSYLSVTQIIRLARLGDDFSMVNSERMAFAQDRGRNVHLACQYYNDGELDISTVHESLCGYVNGYVRFRQDRALRIVANEQRMVCELLGFAGTPDMVCFIDGRRSVVDLKTSQHMSQSMGLQTAGYKILWNSIKPSAPIYERYGLRLEKGDYRLFPHTNPDDEPAFMDALRHAKSEQIMIGWRTKYGKQKEERRKSIHGSYYQVA